MATSESRVPSVKGSLFFIVQANLQTLLEQGKITREELEVRLDPEQLELVDRKLQVALWYPVETFNAFIQITSGLNDDVSLEALAATGRVSAQQIIDSGLYPQLEEGAAGRGTGAGRRLVTLASAFYNFMKWKYVPGDDPNHFAIDVIEAELWCEELRHISTGFIEVVTSRANRRPVRVTSERPSPDHVIFHGRPAD